MKIFDKRRDEMYILFGPDENLSVGQCLDVNGILVQVIDIQYANLPGVLEHLLRKSLLEKMLAGEDAQPNLGGELDVMTDYRLAVTKIRGTIREGRFRPGFFELCADRSNAQIRVLQPSEILELLGINGGLEGFGVIAGNGEPQFPLRLNRLGITLITGMKGSGKSYSAKKLLLRLIDAGKVVVVFDINGEYAGLGLNESGERNRYAGRIKVLVPKEGGAGGEEVPLRIPLRDITYEDFADFMGINGETQMYNELIVYWSMAREFTLGELEQWVRDRVDCDYVKLGLLRKIKTARALKLFGEFDLKGLIRELEKSGGALVVKLKGVTRKERSIIVSFLLRRLAELRKAEEIMPLCVFAEEAQLYATPSMWDDVLTRMRHYGIFPTFITNDPRSLPEEVFSLCDNLIAFKLQNSEDLKQVSRVKMVDPETLQLIRSAENYCCLVTGSLTNDFPLLIRITPEGGVRMGGETRELA
ncbi:MAG: DUF87 domain-containing protein [Candidatus Hadarchaeales archaeon]